MSCHSGRGECVIAGVKRVKSEMNHFDEVYRNNATS